MTVRKRTTRDGGSLLFIEIRYRTADGRALRFRRDAQVQTKAAALAEERRLYAELERRGTLEPETCAPAAPKAKAHTFADAVTLFRATRMPTLKPSTRYGYTRRIDGLLLPRFGDLALLEIEIAAVAAFDLDLVKEGFAVSSRSGVAITLRSVLRCAVQAGMLEHMPKLPRAPKVGRKSVHPMHREDLNAILDCSSPEARQAFALAAFAGLRAAEVRGLRWSDVDLRGGTITVRRGITRGEVVTPKSGSHRVVPIAAPLRAILESSTIARGPALPVAPTAFGQLWGESGLNQAFRRAQRRAQRSGWSFHDLRHFFVTELVRKGAPTPAVQRLAGHADLATTERYADMVATDLRSAVALFEGNERATALAPPIAAE
jgi:integrase